MLAYVFWHRPRPEVDVAAYEEAQRSFHASLQMDSACFRLAQLPFASGGGYEDWYLLADWSGLGELNEAAVDERRDDSHGRVASMSADGWGAVYAALGEAAIPDGTEWLDKPREQPYEQFIASLPEGPAWQRQMVLGPAPEFCLASAESGGRERIWPDR